MESLETFDVFKFVSGFGIIENDYSMQLYSIIRLAEQYPVEIDNDIYVYEDQIDDMISALREMEQSKIEKVLEFFDSKRNCTCDIIIMKFLSVRRNAGYLSNISLQNKRKEIIEKYGQKLINMANHYVLKNFCTEVFTRQFGYIPIECIDLLWHYMRDQSVMFLFRRPMRKNDILVEKKNECIIFEFHWEYMLISGLGVFTLDNISFKEYSKTFLTDVNFVNAILKETLDSTKHYKAQRKTIMANHEKYYGEIIPDCVPID